MGLLDELKMQFSTGTMLVRLILVNIAVFLFINIIAVLIFLFDSQDSAGGLIRWLAAPADLLLLATRPWTLFTYMFLHEGFWHILFNMIVLHFSGRIFLSFMSEEKMLSVYILGGISGAVLYILSYNAFPIFKGVVQLSFCLGASASVLAILVAIATLVPDFSVPLILIGPVRLKYIAVFLVLMDVISIKAGNPGGHIAHLGGALFGYVFTNQYKKGNDWSKWLERLIENFRVLFKTRKTIKVVHKRTAKDEEFFRKKAGHQKRIDDILDKISKSGYESLSKEEKDYLFKASNKDNP